MFLLALCASAHAAPFSIDAGITAGVAIQTTTAAYNPGAHTLHVQGSVTGVSAAQMGNYVAIVQGTQVALASSGGRIVFSTDVDLSPPVVASWYPYGAAYSDEYWMDKPFLVELATRNLRTVVARQHTWISDERTDDGVTQLDPDVPLEGGVVAQLTPTGLDTLESTWLSAVPWPTASTYDQDLSDRLVAEPTQTDDSFEACAPIDDFADFRLTDAFVSLEAEMWISYLAYLAVESTFPAAAAEMCVTTPPDPLSGSYEVCVDQVEGWFTEGSLARVDSVDLRFGGSGIESDLVLDGPTGFVDLQLSHVFLRWTGGGTACGLPADPRPKVTVDFSTVTGPLADWDQCDGLSVGGSGATWMDPDDQSVAIAADPAFLDVTSASGPTFSLDVPYTDVGTGTCAAAFVEPDITPFLETFQPVLEADLGAAWNPASTGSQVTLGTHGGAAATDALLTPFELEPVCDADCTTHLWTAELTSSPLAVPLGVVLETEDEPATGTDFGYVKGHGPETSPIQVDGLDPNGDPFDVSFSLGTMALSQFLTAQAGSSLSFDPADGWDDLGVDPLALGYPSTPVIWDGTTLGAWNPTFAALAGHRVEMGLSPSIAPWAWMPVDAAFPTGEYPVSISLPQMSFTLTERLGGGRTRTWLTALVDYHDSDLTVQPEGHFATIQSGSPSLYVTITSSGFTGTCPYVAHTNTRLNVSSACERQMEADIADLLLPQIQARVEAMLAEVPGLDQFDMGGAASPVSLVPSVRWQSDQYVTVFGLLH